jgi:hypothetical protein
MLLSGRAHATIIYDVVGLNVAPGSNIRYDEVANQFELGGMLLGGQILSVPPNSNNGIMSVADAAFEGLTLPNGFDHFVDYVYYVGNNTSVAHLLIWAVKTPGLLFDLPGTLPSGEGDPIVKSGGNNPPVGAELVAETTSSIPEPSSLMLTAGAVGVTGWARRRRGPRRPARAD